MDKMSLRDEIAMKLILGYSGNAFDFADQVLSLVEKHYSKEIVVRDRALKWVEANMVWLHGKWSDDWESMSVDSILAQAKR